MGSRRSARGLRAAQSRCATTTCASVVRSSCSIAEEAQRPEREQGHRADRPVRELELTLPSVGRGTEHRTSDARAPALAMGDEHDVAVARLDRRGRVTQVHEVRASSDHRGVDPARLDAERVGDEGREVRVETADRDAVDVGGPEPAVVERSPRGPGRERERRRIDRADLGGLGGADDRDPGRGHDALGRNTGSAVSPTGSNTTSTGRSRGSASGSGSTSIRFVRRRGPSSSSTTAIT